MQELEITWSRIFRVWWLITWRATVIGGLAGLVAGFFAGAIAGAIEGASGHLDQAAAAGRDAGFIAGLVVVIPVGLWVLQMAFRKRFRDFRIVMLPPA